MKLLTMTTHNETHAAKADRYLKAAQAALYAIQDSEDEVDFDHPLRVQAEAAIDAAHIHSRLAVAEAIERSFPALVGEPAAGRRRAETTEALPGPLAAYGLEQPAEFLDAYLNAGR